MNKYDSMKRIYDENYEGNIQCKTKIISFPLQVNSGGILAPLFKILLDLSKNGECSVNK